jgi:hypothetical protein
MTVWVNAWQMQCCGEPFSVGSRVTWTLAEADADWLTTVFGTDITVDAAEEHHGGVPHETPQTALTVTAISAVHCRYVPLPVGDQRILRPVRSSAVLTPVTSADGWIPDRNGERFSGYLVQVAT